MAELLPLKHIQLYLYYFMTKDITHRVTVRSMHGPAFFFHFGSQTLLTCLSENTGIMTCCKSGSPWHWTFCYMTRKPILGKISSKYTDPGFSPLSGHAIWFFHQPSNKRCNLTDMHLPNNYSLLVDYIKLLNYKNFFFNNTHNYSKSDSTLKLAMIITHK